MNAIANAQLGGGEGDIDLSGFATGDQLNNLSTELNTKIDSIDFPVDSVNGKTGIVSLSAADVGALSIAGDKMNGHLDMNGYQIKNAIVANPVYSENISNKEYVDNAIENITLNASDVGARPDTWMPTAEDVGAMPIFKRSLANESEDNVVEPGGYAITTNNAATVTGSAPELAGLPRTLYVFNADTSNTRVLQLECRAASTVSLDKYTGDLFYRIITNSNPKVIQPWRRIVSAEEFIEKVDDLAEEFTIKVNDFAEEFTDKIEECEEKFAPAIKVITAAGEDLDKYIQPGIYMWISGANGPVNAPTEPSTNVNGWLHVMSNGVETVKQIWYRFGTPDTNDHQTYVRTKAKDQDWSSWQRYFTTADTIGIANGGTGATTKEEALTKLGAAAATHEHKAGDITSGKLSLANGGTGANFTDIPPYAIIRATSNLETYPYLYYTKTNNGAFYATAENGSPKFDTLPIPQGGTGATTAPAALTNLGAVAKAGDTMTGNLTISNNSPTITFNETDNKSGDHVFNNSRHYLRAKASDTDYYEQFRTPTPSTGLTATKSYDFLTTRDAVTIAQGGTGATTASAALTALGAASATPSITSASNTYNYAHFAKIGNLVICTILPKITATNNLISSATITIPAAYRPAAAKTFTFFSEQAKAGGDTSGKATIKVETDGTMSFAATYQATVHEFSRTICWKTA